MVILKLTGSKLLACKIRIFGIKEIITKHKLHSILFLNPDYAIDSQRNLQIPKRQVFEKIF